MNTERRQIKTALKHMIFFYVVTIVTCSCKWDDQGSVQTAFKMEMISVESRLSNPGHLSGGH